MKTQEEKTAAKVENAERLMQKTSDFILALREEKAKLSSNTAAKLAAKAWKDLEETKEVIDADS